MNKVQLANTYNPAKNYKVAYWYATPKFDGVRAVYVPHSGFFTRNDKPISGLDDMAGILEGVCRTRGLSFVDGELVVAGGSFQASQSAILAAEHDAKSSIEYHVFAVGGDFKDTQAMLEAVPDKPEARIFRVESEIIPNTFEAVEEACRKFTAQGYEGVVLRHPEVPYYEGRSNHLLKFKFFKEADLRIIGVQQGEGRLAGTLGSLVVEGEIGGRKVRANVGTGLTDEDRKILGQDAHLVGKVLTVKYQAITDKPDKNGYYSLRFPSVIGVKEDRDFYLPAETAPITPAKTEVFPTPANVVYHKNGTVEAGFQVVFVNRPMRKLSYIPDKATMAGWKSRLYQCRSIQEGIALIGELKLTIPKIREFARYLGVRLKGCRYLKAEIVRWLINGSLGAKLRDCALMKAVKEKKEVHNAGLFHDFANKSNVIVRRSKSAVRGSLELTGLVSRCGRYIAFRAGRPVSIKPGWVFRGTYGLIRGNYELAMSKEVMNKSSLLEHIRTFRHQVMCELDRLEDALVSLGDSQPEQTAQDAVPEAASDWLTAGEVCKCLKIGQSTFYDHIKAGLLPEGVEFGPRSKRWRMSDILAHQHRAEKRPRRGRVSRIRKVSEFIHA
ncbi:MAG: hypothetical protein IJR85_05445 [Synergistaceae bacterium]|nr:hypothetical protein [Synergistaceae bacterium]